jgi:hypothetical protein
MPTTERSDPGDLAPLSNLLERGRGEVVFQGAAIDDCSSKERPPEGGL